MNRHPPQPLPDPPTSPPPQPLRITQDMETLGIKKNELRTLKLIGQKNLSYKKNGQKNAADAAGLPPSLAFAREVCFVGIETQNNIE